MGGANGAIITGSADKFNRQLHVTEKELIEKNAALFAEKLGLCAEAETCSAEDIALSQKLLTQQALRQVDLTFSKQFSENETARAFLKDIGTQVNYMKRGNSGTIQRFTATGNVYKDHYNSIENIYQLQDLYKDAIGEDAVNALKILNVSHTSAAKRAMFGARDGTVDTIDGMIDLAIMLANDPGQMKEIAQQIYDNPKLLLDGAIEPFLDRYEAGDIAGAIGYALPMIVEGVAGSKGVGTGVNAVKTGAKAVVDLDIEDVTKYVDNVVDDAAKGADNVVNGPRLNNELLAEEVANGHGFKKHVVDGGEFDNLGVTTQSQYQDFVENIVSNPATEVRYAANGKIFYLDTSTKTVVIKNPTGEATAFRPDYGSNGIGWNEFLDQQVPSASQSIKNNPAADPVNNGRTY